MASDFVERTLGPWSSHPANLKKQRILLLCLGILPIIGAVVLCVLLYRDIFNLKDFVEQMRFLTCAAFFSLGFLLTLSVLYLASFTIGSKKGQITNKDDLLFPPWLLIVFCVFWLLPYCLSLMDMSSFLKWAGIDDRRGPEIKAILNMLAIAPFLCVLTWILCAREYELKDNEKLVRRPVLLIIALVCGGLLCASFFVPKYRLCMWIVLLPFTLVFLTLWWFWRKKVSGAVEKKAEAEETDEAEQEKPELPEQAQYIIDNLPEGISYGEDGEEKQIKECSRRIPDDESAKPLIALMNGKVPTEDQAEFLEKFRRLYDEMFDEFIKNCEKVSDPRLPDVILQGKEGSGRTEALCAAAVYAAVVRGQNVLYIVQDDSYADSLASKMNSRFRDLLMDCFYTAGHLESLSANSWLISNEDNLPPNILFASPDQVESNFFCNKNLESEDKKNKLRDIMLSYAVIIVDDFLEMPIPLQAHLAFILDKFRLIQASENVMGQFVVATVPLEEPHGIEGLGARLFGEDRFKPKENAVLLRPRQCEPYWCGTLLIDPVELGGDRALENAARKLLDICTEKKYNTLFYSKGISREEAKELESAYERKGSVSVSAHLYQLDVDKMPFDTILYMSLTSGNADAALRLSLPDDKAGAPVFFRIALKNEPEKNDMAQFALLPNETAISLRAFHLRSVLPFIRPLTPIPDSVWSRFGIFSDSFCKEGKVARKPGDVRWYYDSYNMDRDRYGDTIWSYLVLDSDAVISNVGQNVRLNMLPSTRDSFCRDRLGGGLRGEALCFVAGKPEEKGRTSSQIAAWGGPGGRLGETDLAHSDQLTLVTESKQFSFGGFLDKTKEDAAYAMVIKAQPRRGLSYVFPVRRFFWELPEDGFKLVPQAGNQEFAPFSLRFGASPTHPVSVEFDGLMNPLGDDNGSVDVTEGKYAYDAFMSCLVFLPGENCKEKAAVCRSLSGRWATEVSCGFSSPLTHAFSVALRNRMAGLSFFATTPVFLIEGRDESFGRLVLWLLEPYNSGCTVYPLLAELLPEPHSKFKKALLEDVRKLLLTDDNEYATLTSLRSQSQMAFSGEEDLSKDAFEYEIRRGLEAIDLLLKPEELKQDIAVRKERSRKQEEEREKCRQELIDPSLRSEEDKKRYQRFVDSVRSDLMAYKKVIDLSFCADYGWSPERVNEYFDDFLWNSPEIFFVAKTYHYNYRLKPDGSVASFFVTNLLYDHEILEKGYRTAQRELDQAAADALSHLKPEAPPEQKALKLHDYIVRICEYDQKACDENDPSPRARTAYSVLVRKSHTAVCEGYTMAYRYLLKRAGIRSEEVISKKMGHCWNYVRLGDNWYHVDVTWDDPVYRGGKPKNPGISHEFFLLSDEKIRSKEHPEWSVRGLPPAADPTFDDKDWSTC